MTVAEVICIVGAVSTMIVGLTGMFICSEIRDLRRVIAKLPTHMQERREVVIAPREEGRDGDVKFHFPSSMFGDRS